LRGSNLVGSSQLSSTTSTSSSTSASASSIAVFYIPNTVEGDEIESIILRNWGLISGSTPPSSLPASTLSSAFANGSNNQQSSNAQGGLPTCKIRRVPCGGINSNSGSLSETMDISALVMYLNEDVSLGRKPCMVTAMVGTRGLGQVDDVVRLKEICKSYGVWLHVKGYERLFINFTPYPIKLTFLIFVNLAIKSYRW
jgi:hypothetical protein